MPYSLSVTEGSSYNLNASGSSSSLSLSLTGPAGPSGPAGPAGSFGGDHGALTGRDDDDHTQYLNNTRGDARYGPLPYVGDDPNIPTLITITGITTPAASGQIILPYTEISLDRPKWDDGSWRVDYSIGGEWLVDEYNNGTYSAKVASTSYLPVGLVFPSPSVGAGIPTITGNQPIATYLGQLCQTPSALWRWNGSAWVVATSANTIPLSNITGLGTNVATALAIAANTTGGIFRQGQALQATTATLSTPLPITSGGTGGATPGAARTNLGSKTVGDLLFQTETVAAARNVFGEVFYNTVTDAPARNSNTLVDDPTLAGISLDANSVYRIEGFFIFSATAISGVRFRLVCSGALSPASSFYYGLLSIPGTLAQHSFTQTDGTGSTITRPNITTGLGFYISNILSTSDARTLALQWGQNTTDAAQTATRKGSSWLRVKKIS